MGTVKGGGEGAWWGRWGDESVGTPKTLTVIAIFYVVHCLRVAHGRIPRQDYFSTQIILLRLRRGCFSVAHGWHRFHGVGAQNQVGYLWLLAEPTTSCVSLDIHPSTTTEALYLTKCTVLQDQRRKRTNQTTTPISPSELRRLSTPNGSKAGCSDSLLPVTPRVPLGTPPPTHVPIYCRHRKTGYVTTLRYLRGSYADSFHDCAQS